MKRLLILALFVCTSTLAQERWAWRVGEHQVHADLYPAGPALVVVIHGTGGPDSRGRHYAQILNAQGVSALVVDYKTGIFSTVEERNRTRFLPMLQSTLAKVQQDKRFDPARIGLLGMSLGGVIALHTLDPIYNINVKAIVALYPNCQAYTKYGRWGYLSEIKNPTPTVIMYGQRDGLEEAKHCPALQANANWNLRVIELNNAEHGFDRNEPRFSYREPASPTGYLTLEYNAQAHTRASQIIGEFLKQL